MENIYAMLERIKSIDEISENERKKAAKVLQDEIRAFTAYYWNEQCSSTGYLYVLLCNGNILIREDEDDKGKEVEVINLSLSEMESIKKFMVDTLNYDLQSREVVIDRYKNICL